MATKVETIKYCLDTAFNLYPFSKVDKQKIYKTFERKLIKFESSEIVKAFDSCFETCQFFPTLHEVIEQCKLFQKVHTPEIVREKLLVDDQLHLLDELMQDDEVKSNVREQFNKMLKQLGIDDPYLPFIPNMFNSSFKYIACRILYKDRLEQLGYDYKGEMTSAENKWITWEEGLVNLVTLREE